VAGWHLGGILTHFVPARLQFDPLGQRGPHLVLTPQLLVQEPHILSAGQMVESKQGAVCAVRMGVGAWIG
jgi:hypothetical protein